MSTKTALKQVIAYLDPKDFRKLEQLKKNAGYRVSMSAYAGNVLKQHIEQRQSA